MITAQGLYSWLGILTKELDNLQIPLLETLLVRSLEGSFLCWATARCGGHMGGLGPRRLWGILVAYSTIGTIAMLLFWSTFEFLPEGDAMAIAKLVPIFTILLAWVMRWETLNWIMWIGAILCSSGAVIISKPPFLFGNRFEWDRRRVIGVTLGFANAISAAVSYILMGKIGERAKTATVSLWIHLIGILFTSIPLVFSFPNPLVWRVTTEQSLLMMQFGVLSFSANMTMTRGFQLCNATQGAALQTIAVVFSYTLGYFILGEGLNIFIYIGTFLIGLGVWILAVGKARKNRSKTTSVSNLSTNEGG